MKYFSGFAIINNSEQIYPSQSDTDLSITRAQQFISKPTVVLCNLVASLKQKKIFQSRKIPLSNRINSVTQWDLFLYLTLIDSVMNGNIGLQFDIIMPEIVFI